jgi:16S rRNA (cytosine1402-N4)-methyltransferase
MGSDYHEPVLIDESLKFLLGNKDKTLVKTYVDCTLGGGGYTKKILDSTSQDTKVIAIDRDQSAIEYCRDFLKSYTGRLIFVQNNFAEISDILITNDVGKISGIVMDLGLSSYQLNSEEGFSYQRDTKLDMRADKDQRITAADVLNEYDERDLLRIFKEYGELRYNRQITRDIAEARRKKKFETTFDLAEVLKEKIPPRYLNKDLSKVFQAVRIEVNCELDNLKKVLKDSVDHLEEGARMAVISYHSLEDRIVKNFFRSNENLKVLTKKPVEAGEKEISQNVRARSAKLRAAERK